MPKQPSKQPEHLTPTQPKLILVRLSDYENMNDVEWNAYLIERGINIFHDISYYIIRQGGLDIVIVKQWASYSKFDNNPL